MYSVIDYLTVLKNIRYMVKIFTYKAVVAKPLTMDRRTTGESRTIPYCLTVEMQHMTVEETFRPSNDSRNIKNIPL